jgi:flagellar hook protein FlgE
MLSVTMAALNASQKEMNVTSNNLANASTVGFKRSYANFGDVFSNDPASNPKTAVGAGVLLTSVARDTTAGALKATGRVTDLAIDGRGFFVTRDPAGTANTYSRAGNFSLDAQGFVVDPGGFQVMGFNDIAGTNSADLKPVQIPPVIDYTDADAEGVPLAGPDNGNPKELSLLQRFANPNGSGKIVLQGISISPKGEVQATYSDNKTYTLRFLAIGSFPNDGGLKATGNNRYTETGLSGAANLSIPGAPKAGNIMSGTLEQANVDITNELMDMIRSQQVYNGNARMLQTTMETVSRITDKI